MARTTGQSGGISSTVLAKQIMGDGATYDEFLRQRGKHCTDPTKPNKRLLTLLALLTLLTLLTLPCLTCLPWLPCVSCLPSLPLLLDV
jgi:hypothetical protein